MYDEMRFLFNVDPYVKNKFNTSTKVVSDKNPTNSIQYTKELDDLDKTFKLQQYIVNKDTTQNYIRDDTNKLYNVGSNPYLEYLKFCNESTIESLKISSSDFAYLRDIGVLPINRLMILRRYPVGVIVPVDLNDLPDTKPIATVIGWVKKDTELLTFSFNEVWKTHTIPLMDMITRIIKDEFGPDLSSIAPIPGWGIGFMFSIMNKMGLTNYDAMNVPIGDPNLLKESTTRQHEEYGLNSQFNFSLDTTYEQKYIAGIDPTVTHLEILNNLTIMGTSDVTVIGKAGSTLLASLRSANANPTNGGGWGKLVSDVFTSFVSALSATLGEVGKDVVGFLGVNKKQDPGFRPQREGERDGKYEDEKAKYEEAQKQKNYEEASSGAGFDLATKGLDSVLNSPLVSKILASTLARYQWPLRGAISMFTGEASTPWHLTIGNPYNPLLSMNNIICNSVVITYGKDMGFNDVPRTMDVKITLTQGRSLGKQEIYALFGVTYKRNYKKIPLGINFGPATTDEQKELEKQTLIKAKAEASAKEARQATEATILSAKPVTK